MKSDIISKLDEFRLNDIYYETITSVSQKSMLLQEKYLQEHGIER